MEMLYEYEFEEDYKFGDNPDEDLLYLLNICHENTSDIDEDIVKKAFGLCLRAHGTQNRSSGKPYYTHPMKVAIIIIREFSISDPIAVAACLLHDTIEDTKNLNDDDKITYQSIVNEFGKDIGFEIADIVEAVTKIKHSKTSLVSSRASTYRKLFLSLVKDVRVILIKLADRLHNMRTLHYLAPNKQKTIALETLNFYTPMAHRLGLSKIKMELEDRSLYFTDNSAYEAIRNALIEKRRDFIEYIRVFSEHIVTSLNDNSVSHILTVVHKHIYEIYQMIQSGKSLADIDNFYSMVITLNSNDKFECYKAHGILVNAFSSVEKLIDYVAQPKINWFQSLNTLLVGPDGKLVEVLIRTQEMDKIAEGGIAAYFSLNQENVHALNITMEDIELWGEWMQEIVEEEGEEATQIIWDSIKTNIFDSEIVVFSYDGQKVTLPRGSTPLDFAFSVSDDLGFHFISAKVGGEIKEPSYELQSGDRVYIISSPNAMPKYEWQNSVVSWRAKVHLHNYFKEHSPETSRTGEKKENFEVRLRIRGDNQPGMLRSITEVIGQVNIKRINLDSFGELFEGVICLNVKDIANLNKLFAQILNIRGIRSIEQLDD
ncbi:MAG: hypothetical protein HW421_527 [Ignavibacteria bacterium]|nr:hypothetical protein [Ignavibacteria bacterium]